MGEVYAQLPQPGKQIIENATQRAGKSSKAQILIADPEDAVNNKIRKELNKEFRRIGMTYSELGRKAKLDESAVRRILQGKITDPPFGKIFALYHALGLPLPITQALPKHPRFATAELVKTTARLLSYPRKPNQKHLKQAKLIVEALVSCGALDVK